MNPWWKDLRRMSGAGLGLAAALVACLRPAPAAAGPTNPDISVIGQPFGRWTNAAGDPASKRVDLGAGEVEAVFDAYLNPYARGTVVGALTEEGGLELEEGYFQLVRGLPAGLALKGGKYRVGFGKLNPQHPHQYPFAERFRVLAEYLPGDESLNETGVSLSEQVALPKDVSLTATADWLQGDTFRRPRASSGASNDPFESGVGDRDDEPRPAFNGRLAGFALIGDRSGLEIGASAVSGTNNVAAGTRTTVFGGDVKAKLWNSETSYLLLQAEVMRLEREDAAWDSVAAAYTSREVTPAGGYVYADYNFNTRYNVGTSYERFQQATPDKVWDQALRAFAGFALMEETTAFRVDWEHFIPGRPAGATQDPDATDTITLRVIFSMGPHKAHQF
jgi:hypothetical protein